MAMSNPFTNSLQGLAQYDPYADMYRRQREYELMKAAFGAGNSTPAPAPEKPQHLNPKLLLTKGA